MLWWRLLQRQPAMTEENSGRVWKTEQRRHCFDVMLAMDQIGRRRDRVEIIDHRHSCVREVRERLVQVVGCRRSACVRGEAGSSPTRRRKVPTRFARAGSGS